jgi:hypothetical protein
MSCKDLEIWQLARNLVTDIHTMTLTKLPKFELYEEGTRICCIVRKTWAGS